MYRVIFFFFFLGVNHKKKINNPIHICIGLFFFFFFFLGVNHIVRAGSLWLQGFRKKKIRLLGNQIWPLLLKIATPLKSIFPPEPLDIFG